MSSSIRQGMNFVDYIGFSAMTILIVGAANWLTVGIRWSSDMLPNATYVQSQLTMNTTNKELYELVPTPDLLQLLGASPIVQAVVYYAVGVSGVLYLLLFIWNSIEFRTVDA